LVAFAGSAALWWVYFDRTADDSARVIAGSADPGRLGRSAYHFIHPVMVAGIIVVAAADDLVLATPDAVGVPRIAWLVLGGTGLFLGGHLAFNFVVLRQLNWARTLALVVTGLLGLLVPLVSALALSSCAAAVVVGVCVTDSVSRGTHRGQADPVAEPA
jgi:low temperature requirement protein LtrA